MSSRYTTAYAVYEIDCETPNYKYVGYSRNIASRLGSHLLGTGSFFTQKYGVRFARIICFLETEQEAKRIKKLWVEVLQSRGYQASIGN